MTTKQHASAHHHANSFNAREKKLALLIVCMAFVMDLMDSTIVNIAIPSIQTSLHTSFAAIQWLIAGYALAFAILMIMGGRLGDIVGYKKVFWIDADKKVYTPELSILTRLVSNKKDLPNPEKSFMVRSYIIYLNFLKH